jgi:Xaa-Pro aminopeptidase
MFQTFAAPAGAHDLKQRLARLRELMALRRLDGLLVPRADEHQGEYVPPAAERLAWLTGFTGSAGLAVIAKRAAALFVDGRYKVQARQQVDSGAFAVLSALDAKPADWLAGHLAPGAVVGADARLHTASAAEELAKALAGKGIKLKLLPTNLVDRAWGAARPAAPMGPVVAHALKFAGKPAEQKLGDLQALLRAEGQDAVVLTLPDSIAWLFNIRGSDVAHAPLVLAYAIVPAAGKAEIFLAAGKAGREARGHLASLARISEPAALEARLASMRGTRKRVRLDPDTASSWFFRKLAGGRARIMRAPDPCQLPKARKNATEIKGARLAHKRDGVAIARFLAWLDREAAHGGIDEIAAARRLEELRSETQLLKEIAFDTISGAGPNGAIVHYRVTTASNRRLKAGELFLVDSGAQYLDGTTDITRTLAIGEPKRQMQERFTLVLKGHIAVATARFPTGTRGIDLDPFARSPLWQAGLDFDHGTGHGVGSYLCVHEGPQSISRRGAAVLVPGMILSNEPGYYQEGGYGIRIENLLLVNEAERVAGGEREMMSFETLTLAPIDRRLVVAGMLTGAELSWLNDYHARVASTLGPELAEEDRAWLERATARIG